jgi:sphinganine-1-phosphate aldolase
MRLRWKLVFLALLVAGGALIWQNDGARAQLIHELEVTRDFCNKLADGCEPWQVMSVTAGTTLLVSGVLSFLFRDDIDSLWIRTKKTVFRWIRKLPFVKAKIRKEMKKAKQSLVHSLLKEIPGEVFRPELPAEGASKEALMEELDLLSEKGEMDWKKGGVSGGLYNCSTELTQLNTEVYRRFLWSNPLHPDVFPNIRKMEADVVHWCCGLFHGGEGACGTMTSGGTESIMLAMKVYREIGYEKGIRFPEIVIPATAHAAFVKAGEFFRMKVTRVPIDPQTCQVNVAAMDRAISKDTVVIVGSVPPFPHGVADPIEKIARLARSHKVGLHVDCCLGGFLVAFMEKAGCPIEPFDFRVKGVTSISADTHKYGYCPKGTSVVMYSKPELRHRQFFVETTWIGGLYASAITAGSRPGSLIAATWATMLHFGLNGYVDQTKKVVETARWIINEMRNIPGIYVMGSPKISVFAIASQEVNVYDLKDGMEERGWHLNALQFPPALHMCVTMVTTKEGVATKFVADVKELVEELRRNPSTTVTGTAAMYGSSQAVADRSIVKEMAWMFLDLCYSAQPRQ